MQAIKRFPVMLVVLLLLCTFQYLHAADATTHHRLVVQINKNDADAQDHILSNIVNLQKHYGMDNVDIEVVAYGPGLWLLTNKSKLSKRVESLMLQNVTFTACGNTMDTIESTTGKRPVLLNGVEISPSGIARIMELQEKGWSYLSP